MKLNAEVGLDRLITHPLLSWICNPAARRRARATAPQFAYGSALRQLSAKDATVTIYSGQGRTGPFLFIERRPLFIKRKPFFIERFAFLKERAPLFTEPVPFLWNSGRL